MAAFTSKASGNWTASGQTTWNETGVPGNGDTVTISYPHEITVNSTVTVGTSGAENTVAITVNDSGLNQRGTLKVVSGGTLNVRGDLYLNGGHLWITGTGRVNLDASAAGAPTTTSYKHVWRNVNPSTPRQAKLTMEGTDANNRAVLGSVVSGGTHPGWIDADDFGSCEINMSWALWENLGGGSDDNWSITSGSISLWSWVATDCVFAATVFYFKFKPCFLLVNDFLWERCQVLAAGGPSGAGIEWNGGTYEGGTPTGSRLIKDSVIVPEIAWYGAQLSVDNVIMLGGINLDTSAKCDLWQDVFIRRTAGSGGGGVVLPACDTYRRTFFFFDNDATTNPHYVSFGGNNRPSNMNIDEWVIQPNVGDSEGDMIFLEGTTTFTVSRSLSLPNLADGACGGCFVNAGVVDEVIVEHCTYMIGSGQDGVAVSEIGDTATGTITSLRSNLGYRMTSGLGALMTRSNLYDRTDIATPSGVGYNATVLVTGPLAGYSQITYPRYIGIDAPAMFSVAPNANTTDVANVAFLPFVDSTRNIASYAVYRGLAVGGDTNATKIAAVIDALTAFPNAGDANYDANVTIPDLNTWVRAGWAIDPANTQFLAAHDGTWIGAMQSVVAGFRTLIKGICYGRVR